MIFNRPLFYLDILNLTNEKRI